METKRIDLRKYRGNNSSLFTGRPQGESARLELKLDENDRFKGKIVFLIPEGTSSFNPSFYLGLLYDSISKLGIEEYEKYYQFEILDTNKALRDVLLENIEDGKRSAINAITGNYGFKRFVKRK